MKKLPLVTAFALACAVATPRLSAQSANFIYTGIPGAPLSPGSTFTVHVSLVVVTGGTVGNFAGLSYWFAQLSPAGSPFVLQLNSRNTGVFGQPGASLFTDLQSPGLVTPQVIDPINRNPNGTQTSTDLGALIGAGLPGQPSGTYFIADLTFQVLASAVPGIYTFGNTTNTTPGVGGRISVWNDDEGDTAPIANSSFTIGPLTVPEPSTFSLVTVAVIGAGVAVYRRRRRLRRG
jgi:hypothetical protein